MKIAFIGLGIMGSNMASHLAKNNLNLTVYNRTPKNFETFGNSNVTIVDSIENAIKDADVVFSMLSTPQVVEDLFFGQEGVLNSMKKNAIWADCTTVNPSFSIRAFEEAKKYDIRLANNIMINPSYYFKKIFEKLNNTYLQFSISIAIILVVNCCREKPSVTSCHIFSFLKSEGVIHWLL